MRKFFELSDGFSSSKMGYDIIAYYIMGIIEGRCAGEYQDPETEESWEKYKNIDISIVRSSKKMPEAMEQHDQVSDFLWSFTVEELSEDFKSKDCNLNVIDIAKCAKSLQKGIRTSSLFIKVELS